MVKRLLFFLIGSLFTITLVSAQSSLPLLSPILALNTIEQDAILLYDVTDDTVRELRFGIQAHHVWDFSPDGCRILFTLREGTQPAMLYSARLDGRDLRPMVAYDDLPVGAWGVWEADWSPDGSRIAFKMIRDQPQRDGSVEREYHIAWVTPDDDTPQFYSVTGQEHSPLWSPDGQWLAYVSYEERAAGADINSTAVPTVEPPPGVVPAEPVLIREADLWVVSADGETKYSLTDFQTGSISKPRWSPDSELIGFVYSPSGNNDTFWMIGNQRNAIPTQLSYQWSLILDLTWLPDSTHMIGVARDFQDLHSNRLWQIPLVGVADTDSRLYLDSLPLEHADYPRFSPDGNWLTVRSAYALALVNPMNGQMGWLDDSLMSNTPPIWSPIGFAGENACR